MRGRKETAILAMVHAPSHGLAGFVLDRPLLARIRRLRRLVETHGLDRIVLPARCASSVDGAARLGLAVSRDSVWIEAVHETVVPEWHPVFSSDAVPIAALERLMCGQPGLEFCEAGDAWLYRGAECGWLPEGDELDVAARLAIFRMEVLAA